MLIHDDCVHYQMIKGVMVEVEKGYCFDYCTEDPEDKPLIHNFMRSSGLFERRQLWKNMTKNLDGEWVPAIPFPIYGLRKKCGGCSRKFWTEYGYQSHYALFHILKMRV